MAANFADLPHDIIIKILVGFENTKSIGQFRCVSKAWRSLLSSSKFTHLHHQLHTHGSDSVLVLQNYWNDNTYVATSFGTEGTASMAIWPGNIIRPNKDKLMYDSVHGSCHGLVLLGTEIPSSQGFLLVNPITRETMTVPPIPDCDHENFRGCGLGYDSFTDDFKVVSILADFVDIYSVRTKAWKRIENSSPYHYHDSTDPKVFLKGRINFLSSCDIAAFDLATEKFETVPYPSGFEPLVFLNADSEFLSLNLGLRTGGFTVLGGCLAMAVKVGMKCAYTGSLYDVWVMKEYGVRDSWTKSFSIDLSDWPRNRFIPCFLLGEDAIVLKHYDKFVAYNWRIIDEKPYDLVPYMVPGVGSYKPAILSYVRHNQFTSFRGSFISLNDDSMKEKPKTALMYYEECCCSALA